MISSSSSSSFGSRMRITLLMLWVSLKCAMTSQSELYNFTVRREINQAEGRSMGITNNVQDVSVCHCARLKIWTPRNFRAWVEWNWEVSALWNEIGTFKKCCIDFWYSKHRQLALACKHLSYCIWKHFVQMWWNVDSKQGCHNIR